MSTADKTNVNWADILKYILEAEKSYDLIRGQERVCMTIGYTGAGKTTMLLYIAGKKLKAHGGKVILDEEASEEDIGTIGESHGKSETRFISARRIGNFLFVDAPGIKDTEGIEIDVSNFVTVGEVIRLCSSIVLCIVIDYNSLLAMKGQAIRELFSFVAKLFQGKILSIKESLQLLITHTDTATLDEVKEMLESMKKCNSVGNSKEFIAMTNFFVEELELANSSVKFVRPLKEPPQRLCNALKDRTPLQDPQSLYRFNLPEDTQARLENSLKEISHSVNQWISSGNTQPLVEYLQIFSQLKSRLPLVENVYNKMLQGMSEYLLERQHEAKSRFQDITNGNAAFNEKDINNLNEFVKLLAHLDVLREYLPNNVDTAKSLTVWANTQLSRLTSRMEEEKDFGVLKLFSEKLSTLCAHLTIPLSEDYPLGAAKIITDRLGKLKNSAGSLRFEGLDDAQLRSTLDELYSLINQLDGASKTVGDCVKDINCAELLAQCISTTNEKVSEVAKNLSHKLKDITFPVSVSILQDFAFLREIARHARLSEYFGSNLETSYRDIKNFAIGHGTSIINQIAEGTRTNNVDKIGKFKKFFDQLLALNSLDVEIKIELQPELSSTMLAINQKVCESQKSIEEELRNDTPDYDVVRDFHQYLQNNRWLDEFATNLNKIDEKLKDVENTLKRSADRLKRRIDYCWKRGRFDELEKLLRSAEALRDLADISEDLSECMTMQDTVIDGLKDAFKRIEEECGKKEYSFSNANRDCNNFNNYKPLCILLLLSDDWESASGFLQRSVESKVRALINSIKTPSNNAKEEFHEIVETLTILDEISKYRFLPESIPLVKQGIQSALQKVECIISDFETNFGTAEATGKIDIAREICKQFTHSRCLTTYFPSIAEKVPSMQRRLVTLTADRVDNINLLLSNGQIPQVKTTLLQFSSESSEYINISSQINSHYDTLLSDLRKAVSTFTPADFDGNVNQTGFLHITDLFKNIYQGNITFGDVLKFLNLSTQLDVFSRQLCLKFNNAIELHSQNVNIKGASKVLTELDTMTGFPVSGLDLSTAHILLTSKLSSLINNTSFTFPEEINFFNAYDITNAYNNLQKNKEYYGITAKITEFERAFGQLVEKICNQAEVSPPTDGLAEIDIVRACMIKLPPELAARGKEALDASHQRISKRINSVKDSLISALSNNNVEAVVLHLEKVPKQDQSLRSDIDSKINLHFSGLVTQFNQMIDTEDLPRIGAVIDDINRFLEKLPHIITSRAAYDQALERMQKKMKGYVQAINEFTKGNSLIEGNYSISIVDTIHKLIHFAEIKAIKYDKALIVSTLEPIEVQLSKINELYKKGTMQFDFNAINEALNSTKQAQPLLKLLGSSSSSSFEVPAYLIQLSMALSHIVTYTQLQTTVKEFLTSLPPEAERLWMNHEFDRLERLLAAIISNNLSVLQLHVPDSQSVSEVVYKRISGLYTNVIADSRSAWKSEKYEVFNELLTVVRKLEKIEKLLGQEGTLEINLLMNQKIDSYIESFSSQESVEKLSQRLVDLRTISMKIPDTFPKVHSAIEKLLNMQKSSTYSKLATQIDTLGPCGKLITEEFSHFSAHQRDLWVKKTQGQDISYAIENFRVTAIEQPQKNNNNNNNNDNEINEKSLKSRFLKAGKQLFSGLVSLVNPPTEKETEEEKKNRLQPYLGYYETFQSHFQRSITKYQQSKDPITNLRKFSPIIEETKRLLKDFNVYLPEILANICAVWSLKKSNVNLDSLEESDEDEFWLQPHPVQFLTLYRLLNAPDESSFYSQLVQVKTGEGKSLILGVLSTVFGLLGYEVSCVCYSSYLSQRDFTEFESVFDEFGIKHLIFYSTISKMCNRILNKDGNVREFTKNFIEGTPVAINSASSQQVNRILLIDEADVFFGADFFGNCFNPATLYANLHTFEIAKFIWQNKDSVQLDQLLHHSSFLKLKSEFPEWEQLFVSEIRKMLFDVHRVEEFHPTVKNDLVGYTLHDEISTEIAYGYATTFAYFYFNERGDISEQSLSDHVGMYIGCGSFSYAEIPHMFKLIMGVSGTLESLTDVEKSVIAKYEIKRVACAPSIYGNSRGVFRTSQDVKVINNKTEWLLAIQQSAADKVAAKQAVLIFFSDEATLNEFATKYSSTFRKYQELTERKDHKDTIVKLATNSGTVTVCMRVFDRGVDFHCRDEVTRSSGGVHVIATFLCGSEAEFCQLKGRSARQGDPGSFEMLLLLEDLAFVEVTQEIAEKATSEGTLFKHLQTMKDEFYKAKVQSLIEKADGVKDMHNKTKAFLSLFKGFKGLPAQRSRIVEMIMELNAANMVSTKSALIYHLYFCVDDSTSMRGSPWNDLMEAVIAFISKRIELCKEAGCEPVDKVTIVNYSSSACVSARAVPILQSPEKTVQFRGGGTSFKVGLDTVRLEIEKIEPGLTPVLIFMSDGDSRDGELEIQLLSRDFGANGLQIFVVGFGSGCKTEKLNTMARISGGQYLFGKNGVELKSSFETISTKLSTKTMTL